MHKNSLFVVLLLLAALTAVSSAQEEPLQVVASHSILADVVRTIAGDSAEVTQTLPVGADPHTFQPVPSDLIALAEADIVFVNGALFEEGLLEAIENAGEEMNIVEASACVPIIPFGAADHEHEESHEEDHDHDEVHDHDDTELTDEMSAIAELCASHYAEMEALHADSNEHADSDEHEHHEETVLGPLYAIDCSTGHNDDEEESGGDHDHEHGACDPHVWMEPHNVMYWTMLIRDTLIELDPTNAETYTANAAAYLAELDALSHDFIMPMIETVPAENRVLITNHDSLGYFATRFDFELVGTVFPGGSTASDPSAQDVAALIDLIREENVPAIFAETTVTDALVQTISEETGAEIAILYSGSLSDADGPASTYLDYIRYNVTTIVEALGGGM